MEANVTWIIPDDVVFRELSGEAVILNLATGTYFGLNEVGTRVWSLLAEKQSMEDIVKALLAEFGVLEDVLRKDVGELMKQLHEKGLVKPLA